MREARGIGVTTMGHDKRYTIGELSAICGLSKKTLRYYDERGLLSASERDENNEYRYYTEEQVLDALVIREMRFRGLSFHEMKEILGSGSSEDLENRLQQRLEETEREIREKQEQLRRTRSALELLAETKAHDEDDESQHHKMQISTFGPCTVIYTRETSGVSADVLFWERYAGLQELRIQENAVTTGPFTAVFHDHYTNQFFFDEGDLELFYEVEGGDLSKDCFKEIEPFTFASVIFVGPYRDLLPVYIDLIKQIKAAGYQVTGPAHEIYLLEFSHGVSEDKYVTRVGFPVEKIEADDK